MSKKYKLLRDLINYKAGETLTHNGVFYAWDNHQDSVETDDGKPCKYGMLSKTVEENPDWFAPVEEVNEKKPEQTEDGFLQYLISQKEKFVKAQNFETASDWRLVERLYRQHLLLSQRPAGKYVTIEEVVNEYITKQSPKPKPEEVKQKDWEIVSVVSPHSELTFDGSPFDNQLKRIIESGKKTAWNIRTVRRLSDNQTFTVGDEVYGYASDLPGGKEYYTKDNPGTILGFKQEIYMYALFKDAYGIRLENLTKSTPQPKQKERIEVSLRRISSCDPAAKPLELLIVPTHGIAEWQLPTIKAAIERVLNNETRSCEVEKALPDAALNELWEAIDHWKNKYLDLKMKK